jgi:hypothetical protein
MAHLILAQEGAKACREVSADSLQPRRFAMSLSDARISSSGPGPFSTESVVPRTKEECSGRKSFEQNSRK